VTRYQDAVRSLAQTKIGGSAKHHGNGNGKDANPDDPPVTWPFICDDCAVDFIAFTAQRERDARFNMKCMMAEDEMIARLMNHVHARAQRGDMGSIKMILREREKANTDTVHITVSSRRATGKELPQKTMEALTALPQNSLMRSIEAIDSVPIRDESPVGWKDDEDNGEKKGQRRRRP